MPTGQRFARSQQWTSVPSECADRPAGALSCRNGKRRKLRRSPEDGADRRAVVLAIAQTEAGDPAQAGVSIDVETTLKALMLVAAGIIGQNTNLRTPADVRLEAERLGRLMLSYAKADRIAAEQGGERLLDILGAGLAPEAASNARN